MSQGRAVVPPASGVSLLERAIGYTLGILRLVNPEAMPRPTPCLGWDLRRLLEHLNDGLVALQEAADTHHLAPDSPDLLGPEDDPDGDLVAEVRERASWLLGAWSGRSCPDTVLVTGVHLPAGILTGTGAIEIAVHGWDIATACGHDRPLPPALAAELLTLAPLLVTETERPGHFGPPVPAPPQSGPGDRLLAFLGRHP